MSSVRIPEEMPDLRRFLRQHGIKSSDLARSWRRSKQWVSAVLLERVHISGTVLSELRLAVLRALVKSGVDKNEKL